VKVLSASQDGTLRQWVWGGVKKTDLVDKYHTLQLPRDNLAKLAKKYKIKIGELLRWNGIKDKQELYSGLRIIVGRGKAPVMKTEGELKKEQRDLEAKKRKDKADDKLKAKEKKARQAQKRLMT
jgi:hypothetical protein